MHPATPIDTVPLFPPLRQALLELLRSLRDEDWVRPTAAPLWQVRDVAAHLLDGDLRRLAFHRDRMPPPPFDRPIDTYRDLVDYLNAFNAAWVTAARRLSPRLLTELLAWTGPQVEEHFRSLDPAGTAVFSVAWAGESQSQNWFDVAREYTERWHHQQQIRDAVGAPPLTDRTTFHPVLETFLRGLPHAYGGIDAADGARVSVAIDGAAGGTWTLLRAGASWQLYAGTGPGADASVAFDQDAAWRLFTKGLSREAARGRMRMTGDTRLAEGVLGLLAIMG
jgi:uncharacterized protein (TIGR03083 family)